MRRFVITASSVALAFVGAGVALADETSAAKPPATQAGAAFEPAGRTFDELLAKAKAESKPLFVDFATEWCGWCKKLDADVFPKPEVGEAMKAFVAAHFDAEKGEGVDLAKRYDVHGFPTMVVVDAKGEEIDRIVGYEKPEDFVVEVRRIAKGEGTLPTLRKQVADHPDDLEAVLVLAVKENTSRPGSATARFDDIAKRAKEKGLKEVEAKATWIPMLERLEGDRGPTAAKETSEAIEKFFDEFKGTDAAKDAAGLALRLRSNLFPGDPVRRLAFVEKVRPVVADQPTARFLPILVAEAHLQIAKTSLREMATKAGDDPKALNEVAWFAYEHHLLVGEATGWAKKAVELSKRDPMILDTLASLRSLSRAYDDAIALEDEALKAAKGGMAKEFAKKIERWKAEKDGKAQAHDADGDEHDGDDEDGEDDDDDAPAPAHVQPPAPPTNK